MTEADLRPAQVLLQWAVALQQQRRMLFVYGIHRPSIFIRVQHANSILGSISILFFFPSGRFFECTYFPSKILSES